MPPGERRHPQINLLQAFLLCLLLFCSSLSVAQSISNVSVTKKPGTDQQTSEFTLKISGKGFGTDKSKVSVVVTPKAPILQAPTVTDASASTLIVTLLAPDDYDPETVTVQENGTSGEPYVISTASGQSDLQKYVRVYRSLIDPKDVEDIFGRRIAKHFVVIQVTVTNRNKDYELLIHDISLDLHGVALGKAFGKKQEVSSIELSLLRGVAEKGQSGDRRNVTLRVLRGLGSVGAGLIGVTDFGTSYAPSVAIWNGPVVAAYADIFPDYTLNQMNRLNDSAYSANSIIAKQHSKVMAVFLPQSIFLSPQQMKQFWKDPTSLPEDADLRRIGIFVDGNFITNVEDLAPTLTSATIDDAEMKNFQKDKPEVKGSISGKYLSGTDIKLINSDLSGVTVRVDGTPTDSKLDFVINASSPVAPGKVLKLGVSKKGQDGVKETDLAITYAAATPTLTKLDPATLTQGDQDKVVTLTGTNFLPGSTQVVVAPADGVAVSSVEVKDSKTLEAKVSVTATAATSNRQVTVVTPGGSSSGSTLTVEKKK